MCLIRALYWWTSKHAWYCKNLGFHFAHCTVMDFFYKYVVDCNTLLSITTAFLELEKAMCTVATLLPMLTIITPGPYTHSKQRKTFDSKSNLKVNCEKMSLITKSDCMSVTELSHPVRHLCHEVVICSNLLKELHDFCLLRMTDQLVVAIAFSCFWLKNYRNIVLRYSMTIRQYFGFKKSLKQRRMVWMHSNGVCTNLRYQNKVVKVDR